MLQVYRNTGLYFENFTISDAIRPSELTLTRVQVRQPRTEVVWAYTQAEFSDRLAGAALTTKK